MTVNDYKKELPLRKELYACIGVLNNAYINEAIKTIVKLRCDEILLALNEMGNSYTIVKTEYSYTLSSNDFEGEMK